MTIATIPFRFGGDGAASSNGPVASTSTLTFASITAHIDQMGVAAASGGGVIRKADLEIHCLSNSGSTTTAWTLSLAINGGTAGTYTKTGQAIGGTGGYYSIRVDADFTAWLAANWPAATTSCTIVATVTFTGSAVINATGKLDVTVEWTPASCPTVTKYARILLSDFDGGIGTSFVQIATIPALLGLSAGTFRIPENGATLRQGWAELIGDSGGLQSAASLGTPIVRIGGSTSSTFASETTTGAGNSRLERFYVDCGALTSSQAVELRATSVNASYPFLWSGITVWLHVVYSYTVSGTTEVLVTGSVPMNQGMGTPGYTSESDAMELRCEVQVPDASIVAQGPMGAVIDIGDSDHFNENVRGYQLDGPEDAASVVHTEASQRYERVRHSDSGDNTRWSYRVDAGVSKSCALAPGFNYFRFNLWGSTNAAEVGGETYRRGVQVSGEFAFAYCAPVPAAGPHAVTRNVSCSLFPMNQVNSPSGRARFLDSTDASATERAAPPVPTSAYYLAMALQLYQVQNTTAIGIFVEGKQSGKPYVPLYSGNGYGGFAIIWARVLIALTRYYRQYPAQPIVQGGGWAPATDIAVKLTCGNAARAGWRWQACFHEVVQTITVQCTGYTGDGSGIPVKVYHPRRGLVAEATTAAGGAATFTYPINGEAIYATAAQGSNTATSGAASTSTTLTAAFPSPTTSAEGGRLNRGIN